MELYFSGRINGTSFFRINKWNFIFQDESMEIGEHLGSSVNARTLVEEAVKFGPGNVITRLLLGEVTRVLVVLSMNAPVLKTLAQVTRIHC